MEYFSQKQQRECVQNKLVAERRGSVTKNEGSNNGSPFRGSDRGGMSQQSSSDLDKSLMQVFTLLQPMHRNLLHMWRAAVACIVIVNIVA